MPESAHARDESFVQSTSRRRPLANLLVALILPLLLAACTPGSPAAPQLGALSVTVVGLPEDVAARVSVARGARAPVDVTASVLLSSLEAGAYDIAIEAVCRLSASVCSDVDRFLPEVERLSVDVVAGQTSAVEIVYHCVLLDPPDPVLAGLLLEAVRVQTGDPAASLSCAQVADLRELWWLDPAGDPVTSLEGLQVARRLERLALGAQQLDDLTPLAALGELRELMIGFEFPYSFLWPLAADLSPMLDLPQLERLSLPSAPLTALPDLTGLPALRWLTIDAALVADLVPLASASLLERLDARGCGLTGGGERGGLTDLTPLAGLVHMHWLDLSCHRISDLGPLAGLTALEHLDLEANAIVHLEPLAGLTALTYLDVRWSAVSALETMQGWPMLERLRADRSSVRDLRPLHLHRIAHDTLRRVDLLQTCVEPNRVPSAWYLADLQARGVDMRVSTAVCVGAPAPALTTFELHDEGWTTSGDAGTVRRVLSGGVNDGAYLEADDQRSGSVWYWEAPPKYLGDAGHFHRGLLEMWLKQSAVDAQFVADDIILEGAGLRLVYRHGVRVGTTWSIIGIPLRASGGTGWRNGAEPASDAMLEAVLADLTRLAIRGEYRTGADTGGIARIVMSADTR
jgi:hypothetical protein